VKEKILAILPTRIYLELKYLNFQKSNKQAYAHLQNMRQLTTDKDYSYKPFDDKKVIFVHIPKCAGVSINRILFGNLAGGHTTIEEYLNIFEPKYIIDYFKFTIVRNPWDRLVSSYFFLKQGGFNEYDRTWFEEELSVFSDFNEFVKKWVNKSNIWKWHHFRPQYHYIIDKSGKIELDFIGFLENIDEDFAYITNHMGISCRLPELNRSEHDTYMRYYSNETRDIVAEVYAEDIKLLGYNFDNSNLPRQLTNRLLGP